MAIYDIEKYIYHYITAIFLLYEHLLYIDLIVLWWGHHLQQLIAVVVQRGHADAVLLTSSVSKELSDLLGLSRLVHVLLITTR